MLNAFSRLRRTRAVIATITLMCSQACYSFLPLAGASTPREGDRVRVVLTPEGTAELARYLGPNVVVAEGGLSSIDGNGTMVVLVDYVQTANGLRQPWSGEGVVSFPTMYRREVDERVFQKRRTIVAGTAIATALVTTAIIALRAGGAKGGTDAGGGTPPP
jgi:hypothetical protein